MCSFHLLSHSQSSLTLFIVILFDSATYAWEGYDSTGSLMNWLSNITDLNGEYLNLTKLPLTVGVFTRIISLSLKKKMVCECVCVC